MDHLTFRSHSCLFRTLFRLTSKWQNILKWTMFMYKTTFCGTGDTRRKHGNFPHTFVLQSAHAPFFFCSQRYNHTCVFFSFFFKCVSLHLINSISCFEVSCHMSVYNKSHATWVTHNCAKITHTWIMVGVKFIPWCCCRMTTSHTLLKISFLTCSHVNFETWQDKIVKLSDLQ